MKLKFHPNQEKKVFSKIRIEDAGLIKRIIDFINSLIKINTGTVCGVINRLENELNQLFGLLNIESKFVLEKVGLFANSDNGNINEVSDPFVNDRKLLNATPTEQQVPILDLDGDDDIVGTLSAYFGYEKNVIESPARNQEIVKVRDLIIYLLREYGGMSYPAIGRLIGGRDHTTIIHAYKKTKREIIAHPDSEIELIDLIGKVKLIKERKLRIEKDLISKISLPIIAETKTPRLSRIFKEIPKRNLKILELYREGLTLQNIANVFDVSRERIRQIVISTIRQISINESISKGIEINQDILAEEESKRRKMAKESKKIGIKPKNFVAQKKRWSRYYAACRLCETTSMPHMRHGLCEKCFGQYRTERRDDIIARHSSRCDICKISRVEAANKYSRDLYITKSQEVRCRGCFLEATGKKLKFSRLGKK